MRVEEGKGLQGGEEEGETEGKESGKGRGRGLTKPGPTFSLVYATPLLWYYERAATNVGIQD